MYCAVDTESSFQMSIAAVLSEVGSDGRVGVLKRCLGNTVVERIAQYVTDQCFDCVPAGYFPEVGIPGAHRSFRGVLCIVVGGVGLFEPFDEGFQ